MSPYAPKFQVLIIGNRYGNEWREMECADTLSQVEEIKREWSGVAKAICVFTLDTNLSLDAGPWHTIDFGRQAEGLPAL